TTSGAYGIVLDAVSVTAEPVKFVTYTATDLGLLPGGTYSQGDAVNDFGKVAGFGLTTGEVYHAFISGPFGAIPLTDLGTLDGGNSRAFSVNTSGQVAGTVDTASGFPHAFLSGARGPLIDLGTL